MTVLHTVAPAQRTGETLVPDAAPADTVRTAQALELLRAAEAVAGHADRPCASGSTCRRPGALTVVTEDGSVALCGLHAMTVVFSTEGPVALAKRAR